MKGVFIDIALLQSEDLTLQEAALISIVKYYSNGGGRCFASRAYISTHIKAQDRQITRIINSCISKGYISSTVDKTLATGRFLTVTDKTYTLVNSDYPPSQICPPPLVKYVHHNKENNKEIIKGRFTPPTVEEVAAYCQERANGINPEDFVNHYEASGWMRGKNKIKDWKACVRTWEKNRKPQTQEVYR